MQPLQLFPLTVLVPVGMDMYCECQVNDLQDSHVVCHLKIVHLALCTCSKTQMSCQKQCHYRQSWPCAIKLSEISTMCSQAIAVAAIEADCKY